MKTMTIKEIMELEQLVEARKDRAKSISRRAAAISQEILKGVTLKKAEELQAEVLSMRKELAQINKFTEEVNEIKAKFYAPALV